METPWNSNQHQTIILKWLVSKRFGLHSYDKIGGGPKTCQAAT
jgi:hypothetical protein